MVMMELMKASAHRLDARLDLCCFNRGDWRVLYWKFDG